MSKLEWGRAGDRLFETGIGRGVLYPELRDPVPWIGLTGLEEDFSEDGSEPLYFDGLKVRDIESIGDFAGTLAAFTYPDEFSAIQGIRPLAQGFYGTDQQTEQFHLAFRTHIGNDIEGLDYGYKLHVIHNLSVIPAQQTRETHSEEIAPQNFEWEIAAVPSDIPGYRPTAHFIFDSTRLDPAYLSHIENKLYGTATTEPQIMTAAELMALAANGPA